MIHCHSAKGGIIGRTAGWIIGVKTFYTPHAFSYLCTPSKLKRWVFMAIERLTRFKTYVLACSESEQKMAIKEVGYSEEHALVWHNAVPEAMANGKAIIASDVVENKDCVRNGENGYLLPLDADAYADKIIQLVNDKELRTSMEEKSRALFLKEFFIENRNKNLQNQYNMVYNLRYGGANLVLLKTNIDNVIQVSVGYDATLYSEERRVAA